MNLRAESVMRVVRECLEKELCTDEVASGVEGAKEEEEADD